jgi:hypothetical protein
VPFSKDALEALSQRRARCAGRDLDVVPARLGGSARGKLKGAAQHWAKGFAGAARVDEDDDIVRQLRAGGASEEEIAKLTGQEGDGGDFEIWPENADALRAFLFAETQWNVIAGMAGVHFMGLKYEAVEKSLRAGTSRRI